MTELTSASASHPLHPGGGLPRLGLDLPPLRYLERTERDPERSASSAGTPSSASLGAGRRSSGGVSTAATSPGRENSPAQSMRPPSGPSRSGEGSRVGSSTHVGLASGSGNGSHHGGRRYDLQVLQQPQTGAEVGWGHSTLGRLPLVPALVVRLRIFENDGAEVPVEDVSPMLICSCSLLPGDASPTGDDEALDTIQRPVQGDPSHMESRASLVGTLQSSMYKLRPLYGPPGSLETYFIFSDVAVRVTGRFRLRISLIEARPSATAPTVELSSVVTAPFNIVDFARYPGETIVATELTMHFAALGQTVYLPPYSGNQLPIGL